MNNDKPFKAGDRVRLRKHPRTEGTIWDIVSRDNMVIVDWGNIDDEAQVYNPHQWLEKIK